MTVSSAAYLRHLHVRGDLLTFIAEDDVWTCPAQGGEARRLSADRVPAAHPRISPDGRWIAWTSTRDGAPEVHVAPSAGGEARRLTHWGDRRTRVADWTPQGEVLVISAAGAPSPRRPWAWSVPLDEAAPRRLPYGPVGGLSLAGDGRVVLQTPVFAEAMAWKRYRGGTAGRLWVDLEGDGEFVPLHPGLDGNVECPLWVGSRVAFLSDHDGAGALWSSLPDGTGLTRHARHDGFYARQATTDGQRVVYGCAGELWILPDLAPGTEPRPLAVRLGGPRTARTPRRIAVEQYIGDFCPDATGRGSAVEARGAVHWLPHAGGPARALAAEAGVRRRLPRVLGDTGRIAWLSDAGGEECVEVSFLDPDGTGTRTPVRLGAGRLGRAVELAASPDGATLAVANLSGEIVVIDVASTRVTPIDRSQAGEPSGLTFSPDSAWLAWSHPGPERVRQLRLARLRDGRVVEATPPRFSDHSPAFTADGRYLAFLSERVFEPVHLSHDFGAAFVGAMRPFLLLLAAGTPTPFDACDGGGAGAGDDVRSLRPPVVVDAEGLADRVEPFPVEAGTYHSLRSTATGVLWVREAAPPPTARAHQAALEGWDLGSGRRLKPRSGVTSYRVSADGTRAVARHHDGTLAVVPTNAPADGAEVDLARIRAWVHPAHEWRQIFEEDWRLLRDVCVRSHHGDTGWEAVRRRYRPLVERLGSQDDLVDLLWEMHGEVGLSHTNVVPRPRDPDPATALGHLGADLTHDPDGVWRIAAIPRGEVSAEGARSPLSAAGVGIRPGDALLAVDGTPVASGSGPGPLLAGTAGRPVELTVRTGTQPPRTVTVRPLADERPLRYHTWVALRRDRVHRDSGGRLGYIHLPDLREEGWAQLHRHLRTEIIREGLVLDIRENAGGELSEKVLELLAHRVSGWRVARNGYGHAYPNLARRGPVVILVDEFTGSDGDVMALAVRHLGLGPVVGARTWGGFTSIDWQQSLVDGTRLILPRFATWHEGAGWSGENHGVEPDVEVTCAPQDWVADSDPQLAEGIRQALALLDERPAAVVPTLPWPQTEKHHGGRGSG
ncbi:S41 family peptidase [Streptomyces sp. HMX87]|uniref:S41 family peptidase n=1 Tax=Streptomyces sp. HMX87 TaxID=3390849 RepID=UPI003A8429FF